MRDMMADAQDYSGTFSLPPKVRIEAGRRLVRDIEARANLGILHSVARLPNYLTRIYSSAVRSEHGLSHN